MKTYIVTYRTDDAPGEGHRDLGPVFSAIQSLGVFAHVMESVWMVCTTLTAQQLHTRLAPRFSGDDRLLIVECGDAAEWRGIPLDTSVWLDNEFNAVRHLAPRRRFG